MIDFCLIRYVQDKSKPGFEQELDALRQRVEGLWASTDKCRSGFHEILLLGDMPSHGELGRVLMRFHPHVKVTPVPSQFHGRNRRINSAAVLAYLLHAGGFGTDPVVNIPEYANQSVIGASNAGEKADYLNDETVTVIESAALASWLDVAVRDHSGEGEIARNLVILDEHPRSGPNDLTMLGIERHEVKHR